MKGKPKELKQNAMAAEHSVGDRNSAESSPERVSRYQVLFECAHNPIMIVDDEGRYIDANEAALRFLETEKSDLLKKNVWSFSPPGLLEAQQAEHSPFLEHRTLETVYSVNGSNKILMLNVVPFKFGRKSFLFGIGEDITERRSREIENQRNIDRIRNLLGGTVRAIAAMVEMRDPYTSGHQRRVADLARAIATHMGLSTNRIDALRIASVIHDIGKISIPAEILSKPMVLSPAEFEIMKQHSKAGHDILKNVDFHEIDIARMVMEHHERIDGSGYPGGLNMEQTLIESRIIAVADVVEAMASHRPYRPALGLAMALEEIEQNSGVIYDPDVVAACMKLFNELNYKLQKA